MNNEDKNFSFLSLLALAVFLVAMLVSSVQAADKESNSLNPTQKLARDIFRELIEIKTTHAFGATRAAEAMANRLRAAGFSDNDIHVLGPLPNKRNLIVRLRSSGKARPVLFLAHLDVVDARPEDWTIDPFKLLERDGYFYGRGTTDVKDEAADLIVNLIRLRKEGYAPKRDIVVALTDDEEAGGDTNGVAWLMANHRNLIDAEYCINTDGGSGDMRNGRHVLLEIQTGEKVYVSFQLEVKNRGGHSSLPVKDNAIYRLAQGLVGLSRFEFPVRLNDTTRTFFERMAGRELGQLAEDMIAVARPAVEMQAADRLASSSAYYNALMRTTCVATLLSGGHAENALPQTARATVNCRLLPDDSAEKVQQTLEQVLADSQIVVSLINKPRPSPLSPLRKEVVDAAEQITKEMWPDATIAPVISTGATDGVYLRRAGTPVYGVSGMFIDIDDTRAHGRDERIGVKEFYEGIEFMYRFMKALTSTKP